jgi:hypothetical protein
VFCGAAGRALCLAGSIAVAGKGKSGFRLGMTDRIALGRGRKRCALMGLW